MRSLYFATTAAPTLIWVGTHSTHIKDFRSPAGAAGGRQCEQILAAARRPVGCTSSEAVETTHGHPKEGCAEHHEHPELLQCRQLVPEHRHR